jgi:hypothetical protein
MPIETPPEADLWRRNIMTIVWIVVIWAAVMLVLWLLGVFPAPSP